ncbi:cytochrome P450 [Sphingomonas sp. C8-2]|jgi:cytochrome P450|uniref:Cytochrome P450 n=1 Tax=Rhizorhabdus histidinilytica TaxID=439228 RepID=A0A1T5A5Y9_9SPHN|nr:cytochrome P450 [Rhizorhabdus histidinilytica]QEH78214.1 cytochrome P450 [Sphingomonas sp. C8-2]SKB30394.1 Cytochrome P450 [Rhizorhabdus histidinilytica]
MESAVRIQEFDDPNYDPFNSDEINFGDHADPYPLIARWRAEAPVIEGGYRPLMGLPAALYPDRKMFTVVGSSEVNEVLTDTDRFSNAGYKFNLGVTFGQGSISTMDNPEHGRWRRIFQKIFLPQYVKKWGETIVDPVVHGLMDKFLPLGHADLIEQFTLRYPFEVIYHQLALPEEDVHTFQRLALGQTDYVNHEKAIEAGRKLGDYFTALVEERRRDPGEDLVSLLALTEVDGEYLPHEVLISFLRQLMNAAGDTTYRGTSILLTALLEHPDQMEAIRADRGLIPQAIEEALRWDGPVAVQMRMAAVDTELAGVAIPAGSLLDVVAGAANRDPEIYADPDRFDIFRDRKPHFAFSRGPHICVGQHLARVEMTRALHAALDHLPGLRFDPDKAPPQIQGSMMRVPRHLYVRFGD